MSMESLKIFLNKLKNTFVYRILLNNIIVIAIIVTLFIITINNIFFLPLFILYFYYIYKKSKLFLKISTIIILLISIKMIVYRVDNSINLGEKIKVNDVIRYDNYQKIIYKKGYKKAIIYDFDNYDILPGDCIEITKEESMVLDERIEGGFNYKKYLKNNHIYKIYNLKELKKIERSKFNFFNLNLIKYKLNRYVEKKFNNNSRAFIKGLVLGDKNEFDDEFVYSLQGNGTIHLFAISGLHVGIIIMLINKILLFLKIKRQDLFISIFLLVYLFITSFSPSIMRAVLMYYLSIINKNFKLNFSSSDIISLSFLILVIINPLYVYNQGFVLSFGVSFFIILFTILIRDYHNLKQSFLISLCSNVFVLPVIININNEINFLSPVVNVLFIFLVSSIILPFSFLVMVFPYFKNVYESFVSLFIEISVFVNNNVSLKIIIPRFSKLSIALYYYLIVAIIYFYKNKNIKRNLIVILSLLLFFVSFIKPTLSEDKTVFFDLDEGDSTLIINKSNDCIALIDTGTGKNNEITKYLKRNGIRKLDYLFLTHNHNDHNGEAKNIIDEINVNKIVVSAYDNSEFANYRNTLKVKKGDTVTCGGMKINVLHPDMNYLDINDNSIVLHTKIGKHYFLFLGDASNIVEEKLINFNIKVDCVKVAHHGSTTSTQPSFINHFKPQYAVIMTGRVKKFGFPNQKTISTLNNYNVIIYRTDLDYSIIFKKNKFMRTNKT